MTMRHVNLDFAGLFDGSDLRADGRNTDSENDLLWLMEQVAFHNLKYLDRHSDTPLLYDSGVRYELPEQLGRPIARSSLARIAGILRKEGVSQDKIDSICNTIDGVEVFRDTPRLYAVGAGDCDNLTMTRLAELWRAGIPARAAMTSRVDADGNTTYHALIKLPPMPGIAAESGIPQPTMEDPSRILGMGWPERAGEGHEEIRKNLERVQTMVGQALQVTMLGGDGPTLRGWIETCGFVPLSPTRRQKWLQLTGVGLDVQTDGPRRLDQVQGALRC